MRLIVISAAALALACSSVEDRAACATSASCPSGQYCARTSDGSVCWADAVRPAVSLVTASCATTPCVRDGVLRVEATVTEDKELATVEAALDLDSGARKIAMTAAGGRWVAELPLRDWPFEAYARPVVVSVVARDGARNEGSAEAVPVEVTRLRWVYDAGVPMSPAAVHEGGLVLVGLSRTTEQLVGLRSDGAKAWSITAGNAFVTAAPATSTGNVWFGSWAGVVYSADPVGELRPNSCATGDAVQSSPALVQGSSERLVAGTPAGTLAVADATGFCSLPSASASVTAPPVVLTNGDVIVVATSVLESFSVLASGSLRPNWTGVAPAPAKPTVGSLVTAPPAVDALDGIWTVDAAGKVNYTTAEAVTAQVTTAGANASGPIVLGDGSVVLGDQGAKLRRFSRGSTPPWAESSPLEGVPTIPMVVSGPSTHLIVPTSTGRLYAIRESDGSIAWSVKLSAAGAALQPANIYTPPGQPAGAVMSTAYVAGADGKLYAVIVDGELDTSAPWPKAFHDPRNTNNAGTQP
ncbi:pyrrolo-quinoline quinone [Anaeromyxobacter sp. SG17]|uniref:pyrrolo-quinoline quinone n=1 Tax=Anaeromyxobacter sp. SG17 TaxID=2925405 RepID=UPI001F55CB81|nr:pyrrolo-quinoline quinone [Anaeromyxobacter sp. SG17]